MARARALLAVPGGPSRRTCSAARMAQRAPSMISLRSGNRAARSDEGKPVTVLGCGGTAWGMPRQTQTTERCALCDCLLHRTAGTYATPTIQGRSHATRHHNVAERFFGRSKTRSGRVRERLFEQCPWGVEGQVQVFCYECHEELLHNPVFLPADVSDFARLVGLKGLAEAVKTADRASLAGRVRLLQQVIRAGLDSLLSDQGPRPPASGSATSPRSRTAR
jgi:hypothetical protein